MTFKIVKAIKIYFSPRKAKSMKTFSLQSINHQWFWKMFTLKTLLEYFHWIAPNWPFFFFKVKREGINVINLEDITPSILFCITVNLIVLKHFIGKINVRFAKRDTRPWETNGLSIESPATARLSHLTGEFGFSYVSLPRKQSPSSFFQMVTLSYPAPSPHNAGILNVGWWVGLKKSNKIPISE